VQRIRAPCNESESVAPRKARQPRSGSRGKAGRKRPFAGVKKSAGAVIMGSAGEDRGVNARKFWGLLQKAQVEEGEGAGFAPLQQELSKLPPAEILQFRRLFEERLAAAHKIDLWGAAYLVNGGCSDDGFHHFCCWLVGMGKRVYEKALADPDSLAEVVDGEEPCEADLDVAAVRAWEKKTGRTTEEFYDELKRLGGSADEAEEGEDWDFDDEDEMRRRFPRLCRLCLPEPDE
jgi:hypothetical protein